MQQRVKTAIIALLSLFGLVWGIVQGVHYIDDRYAHSALLSEQVQLIARQNEALSALTKEIAGLRMAIVLSTDDAELHTLLFDRSLTLDEQIYRYIRAKGRIVGSAPTAEPTSATTEEPVRLTVEKPVEPTFYRANPEIWKALQSKSVEPQNATLLSQSVEQRATEEAALFNAVEAYTRQEQ